MITINYDLLNSILCAKAPHHDLSSVEILRILADELGLVQKMQIELALLDKKTFELRQNFELEMQRIEALRTTLKKDCQHYVTRQHEKNDYHDSYIHCLVCGNTY